MKNIVLIHLESLSNKILLEHQSFFPNIRKWSSRMVRYSKYYSSATSTYMTILDLFMGNMTCFEKATYLENVTDIEKNGESLFDELDKRGYRTTSFFYSYELSDYDSAIGIANIISPKMKYWLSDDADDFREELRKSILKEPFALFVDDNISHVGYNGKRLRREEFTVSEWYEQRYRLMDDTFGLVMDTLEKQGVLDNTIVFAYGDHGEEYWEHGMYEGYTHAIEPFNSCISCPLFEFGSECNGVVDELVSTVDIKNMILRRIGNVNAIQERKFALSRNLYAAQKNRMDLFHKAYAITDGEFLLILTRNGYQMFNSIMDSGSQNNLLNYFTLINGKLFYLLRYNAMISSHFRNCLNQGEIKRIEESFYVLDTQLQYFLSEIKPIGLPLKKKISYQKEKRRVVLFKYGKWKRNISVFIRKNNEEE